MKRVFLLCLIALSYNTFGQQPSVWTLQSSIQYALNNNIDIKQSAISQRLARLISLQTKLSQLPDINGVATYGESYGRSINPVTNQFVEGSYNFTGISGNASLLVFGWLQRRNVISATRMNAEAAKAEADNLQDNVALNVTAAYLDILRTRELVKINQKQIDLTETQLGNIKRSAKAGVSPELNVVQLEAQIASDSAELISSQAEYEASILQMKALLNLDFNSTYVPAEPPADITAQLQNATLSSDEVYAKAKNELGIIKASELRLSAARKTLWAAKGAMLPQLGAFYQIGSNYTSLSQDYVPTGSNNLLVSGTYVDVNGNQYPIYQNTPTYNIVQTPFNDQLSNNLRQTVGLSLTVPIFNGWRATGNMLRARMQVQDKELENQKTEQKLKQDIYTALSDAKNALQKYYAAQKAATAAQKAQELAQKRYGLGLATMVEYLAIQNNLYASESKLLTVKYELIFKNKILDHYMGRNLGF